LTREDGTHMMSRNVG